MSLEPLSNWGLECCFKFVFSTSSLASFITYYLLQLVFSASVTAVKSRPVLHHCVVKKFLVHGLFMYVVYI